MWSRILLSSIGVLLAAGSYYAAHVLRRVDDIQTSKPSPSMLAEHYRVLAFEHGDRARDLASFLSVRAKLRASNGWPVTLEPTELAELHAATADPYSEDWESAIILLALAGHRDEASAAVVEFICRREDIADKVPRELRWHFHRKTFAVQLLGITATPSDFALLRRSVTLDGARELTKNWIDQISSGDEYEVFARVQGSSGRGLAYSGTPKSHEALEKAYSESQQLIKHRNAVKPRTNLEDYEDDVYGKLADAMALRDFVQQLTPGQAVYILYFTDRFREILRVFGEPYITDYGVVH